MGKGWEVHVEGQKLKQDGEAFRQKLNTQQLFEDWKKKVKLGDPRRFGKAAKLLAYIE